MMLNNQKKKQLKTEKVNLVYPNISFMSWYHSKWEGIPKCVIHTEKSKERRIILIRGVDQKALKSQDSTIQQRSLRFRIDELLNQRIVKTIKFTHTSVKNESHIN